MDVHRRHWMPVQRYLQHAIFSLGPTPWFHNQYPSWENPLNQRRSHRSQCQRAACQRLSQRGGTIVLCNLLESRTAPPDPCCAHGTRAPRADLDRSHQSGWSPGSRFLARASPGTSDLRTQYGVCSASNSKINILFRGDNTNRCRSDCQCYYMRYCGSTAQPPGVLECLGMTKAPRKTSQALSSNEVDQVRVSTKTFEPLLGSQTAWGYCWSQALGISRGLTGLPKWLMRSRLGRGQNGMPDNGHRGKLSSSFERV